MELYGFPVICPDRMKPQPWTGVWGRGNPIFLVALSRVQLLTGSWEVISGPCYRLTLSLLRSVGLFVVVLFFLEKFFHLLYTLRAISSDS